MSDYDSLNSRKFLLRIPRFSRLDIIQRELLESKVAGNWLILILVTVLIALLVPTGMAVLS